MTWYNCDGVQVTLWEEVELIMVVPVWPQEELGAILF